MENEAEKPAQTPTVYEAGRPPALAADDPILKLITDKSISLDRVREVLALRKEVEQESARRAFNVAMAQVKARIPEIIKNAENKDNHSRYATLDAIGAAVDPILADNGISTSFYPVPTTRENFVKVECVVSHVEGYERRFEVELPFDTTGLAGKTNKTQIHGWRSATTYARRTLYEMIFDIKSKKVMVDDDGNAAGAPIIASVTEAQVEQIRDLVASSKTDAPKLLDMYGLESFAEMSLIQFGEIRVLLEQKVKRLSKEAGQ